MGILVQTDEAAGSTNSDELALCKQFIAGPDIASLKCWLTTHPAKRFTPGRQSVDG